MPHVAGGRRGEFNLRFGQPSLNVGRRRRSLPPFNDEGVFARLPKRGRTPKIIASNSTPGYWRGDASLIHTDIEGRTRRRAAPPSCAPIFSPAPSTPRRAAAARRQLYHRRTGVIMSSTSSHYSPLLRSRTRQPRSLGERRRRAAGERVPAYCRSRTAVEAESLGALYWPPFPASASRPRHTTRRGWISARHRTRASWPIRRRTEQPVPRRIIGGSMRDGNEAAGLRPTELPGAARDLHRVDMRACGYRRRGRSHVDERLDPPVSRTKADRERSGDPRRSIPEPAMPRSAAYLEHVREKTTRAMIRRAHTCLAKTSKAIVERATRVWEWVHKPG